MLTFLIPSQSVYIWWITPLMLCSLAFAYPTATTIISNGTCSKSQGGILGVYQSVCAAAMGLSPLFVGSAIGAYPSLTAWVGPCVFYLLVLDFGIAKNPRRNITCYWRAKVNEEFFQRHRTNNWKKPPQCIVRMYTIRASEGASMFGVEVASFVQMVQEPKITFDLQKVRQIYDNYVVNYHAGLTMVMGHPFGNPEFCRHILQEQVAIKDVFTSYGLEDLLILYDVESQVHATLIELASQHDKEKTDQQFLNEDELLISSKTKNIMNINYSVRWIKKTPPFEIELGPDVLSKENCEQTLRITDAGQIVMKGRAKDRKLLAEIRAEFEKRSGCDS